jgi:hypothetical protein
MDLFRQQDVICQLQGKRIFRQATPAANLAIRYGKKCSLKMHREKGGKNRE